MLRKTWLVVAWATIYVAASGWFFLFPLGGGSSNTNNLQAMQKRGDWSGMLEEANIQLGRYEKNADWLNVKGYALMKLNRCDEAIPVLKASIDSKRTNTGPWGNLADCYKQQKRFADMVGAVEELTKLRPDLAQAWYALGEAHYLSGDTQKVAKVYNEVYSRNTALAALYKQNFMPATEGRTETLASTPTAQKAATAPSINEIQARLAADPTSSKDWTALGTAYASAGEIAEAERALKEAVRVNPKDAAALYNLGKLYQGKGERDKAREVYQQLNAADPDLAATFFREYILP